MLDRVQRLALDLDMPMMITGDYNTHHALWALEGQQESPWAEQLIEWMVDRERFTNDECKGSTHILLKKQ